MHALFFEMRPKSGHLDHYFEHVARLRPVLARHSGLVFLDRYGALGESDVLLSHQLWEDEAAIIAWRKDAEHRRSQEAGRHIHFSDYRIRVGERFMLWQPTEGFTLAEAKTDLTASFVLAIYGTTPVTAPPFSAFESFNHKGRFISLASFDSLEAAETAFKFHIERPGTEKIAVYSIHRDYGQFDRAQAPQ